MSSPNPLSQDDSGSERSNTPSPQTGDIAGETNYDLSLHPIVTLQTGGAQTQSHSPHTPVNPIHQEPILELPWMPANINHVAAGSSMTGDLRIRTPRALQQDYATIPHQQYGAIRRQHLQHRFNPYNRPNERQYAYNQTSGQLAASYMPRVQDANSRYVWTPIFTGTPNQSMLPVSSVPSSPLGPLKSVLIPNQRVVLGTDNGLPQPARGNFASLMPPSGTGDQNRSIQFPCFRRRGNMKFCLNGVPIRDFVSLDPGFNTKVEDADAVVIDMSKESFILLISYPEYPVLSVGVTISAEPAESQTRRYTLTRGQLLIQICSIVCEFMNMAAGVKGPESPYRIGRGGVGLGQVIFSRIYQTWEDTWVLKLYPIVSIIETPSTQKDF